MWSIILRLISKIVKAILNPNQIVMVGWYWLLIIVFKLQKQRTQNAESIFFVHEQITAIKRCQQWILESKTSRLSNKAELIRAQRKNRAIRSVILLHQSNIMNPLLPGIG